MMPVNRSMIAGKLGDFADGTVRVEGGRYLNLTSVSYYD